MAWYQMGHQCSPSVLLLGTVQMIDKTFGFCVLMLALAVIGKKLVFTS